jgi:hypothetical protein
MTPGKVLALIAAALVVLILALPLADWAYSRLTAADRGPYVRDNERILNSLPVFPGARELARGSAGYHADNGDLGVFDRTIGYSMGVDYAIPKGTRRNQVISFYVGHMRGWRLGAANYRDGIVDFIRGKAYVAVDASEVGMAGLTGGGRSVSAPTS